jgi:hypothetical protein
MFCLDLQYLSLLVDSVFYQMEGTNSATDELCGQVEAEHHEEFRMRAFCPPRASSSIICI